jgi:ABC-type antimicrobial peptide transport system permease subunit
MRQVEKNFKQVYPSRFYNASWFDEMVGSYYETEATASTLFRIFSALAIFIACLGVYGLVAFMVARKTKEVGIRKVLGATTASILSIFSREFTKLIALAFIIATPVSIWIMSHWLLSFSYHVGIRFWIPVCSVVSSLIIAWATIGFKAARAAMANPVSSLRSD